MTRMTEYKKVSEQRGSIRENKTEIQRKSERGERVSERIKDIYIHSIYIHIGGGRGTMRERE